MNGFERSLEKVLGRERLAMIREVRVGLAGAGGLGSNCAQMLARSGFSKFKIVDFDLVEESNLNRQFYFPSQVGRPKAGALKENLLMINPDLEIEALTVKIAPENLAGLFADCPVVVEALDDPAGKKMLVEALVDSARLLVAASGLAGWGSSDGIRVRRVRENFYLVGDLVSEAGPDLPALAPGVNVAAAKQADVVLSFFLGKAGGGAQCGWTSPARLAGDRHLRDYRLGILPGPEQYRGSGEDDRIRDQDHPVPGEGKKAPGKIPGMP